MLAKRIIKLSVVFLLSLVAVIPILATVWATPANQELPPTRLNLENFGDIPNLAQDERGSQITEFDGTTTTISWSKVSYQSFQDGNWEIYVSNDDASGQIRLTNNSAADIHPHLNRGADRIAFASNRDGDYEIYTMNLNGSGLTQITFNNTDDVNPVWSPDGTHIAFQAYRDGQAEIYTMNANGTAQTRLTADADYDATPSWSPDGTKIAFVSRRTGGYRIYIMNANGSGLTQISNQPYSFNPTWSPDGAEIAFDADSDGDGWQDLWLMNHDGDDQRKIYDPFGQTDAWAHSWSPDGRYVAFTQISFVNNQGNWYWTYAYLDAQNTQPEPYPYPSQIRLNSDGGTWNPGWQTTDVHAPQSHIIRLPSYSRINEFKINWTGVDDGGSGIATYDIQYRVGEDGIWTDWETGAAGTSIPFTSTPGTVVYFRSRAHDQAYNVEDWPNTGDTSTTFYYLQTAGNITDNRGTPLSFLPVTIDPSPLISVSTNLRGDYLGYTVVTGTHSLAINNSSYDTFEPILTEPDFDSYNAFYLAPHDNVIENGSFEANDTLPTAWQINGTLPISVTNKAFVTGNQALVLGSDCASPCLTSPEFISAIDAHYSQLDMDSDSNGNVHGIWRREDDLLYSTRSLTGIWSTTTVYTESDYPHDGLYPHIAVDSHDTLHIAWVGTDGYLKYSQRVLSGSWTPPQNLAYMSYGPNSKVHDIAFDNEGRVHILCNSYHIESLPNGQWSQLTDVAQGNTPQMAIGHDNTLHFVWQKTYANVPEGDHVIFYVKRNPNGVWESRTTLYNEFDHFFTTIKDLQVDANGIVHIFFAIRQTLYHGMKPPGKEWETPVSLVDTSVNTVLDTDDQGSIYLINTDNDSYNPHMYFRQFTLDSGWSDPIQLSNPEKRYTVALTVDNHSNLHFVSVAFPGIHYYQTLANAGVVSDTIVSQVVTIPNSNAASTLSFMSKANGDTANDSSYLEVSIIDNVNSTSVFSDTLDNQWALHWLDLQPWIGQTVTVSFKLKQEADDPFIQLFLDDITLGSSYPDVKLDIAGAGNALPAEEVVYTISYENQGGVNANGGLITVTLPDELAFAYAGTPPISTSPLIWDIGDLPAFSEGGAITFTTTVTTLANPLETVTVQADITTASPEMEVANNQATLDLFIGRFTFLPILDND